MNKEEKLVDSFMSIMVGCFTRHCNIRYTIELGKDIKCHIRELLQGIMEKQEKDIEYGGLIDALKVFIERGEELKVCEITDHLLMAIQALEWKRNNSRYTIETKAYTENTLQGRNE